MSEDHSTDAVPPRSMHPRIAKLLDQIEALTIGDEYRVRLTNNVYRYAGRILCRPHDPPLPGQLSDLEAMQQVAMADSSEENLQQYFQHQREAAMKPRPVTEAEQLEADREQFAADYGNLLRREPTATEIEMAKAFGFN